MENLMGYFTQFILQILNFPLGTVSKQRFYCKLPATMEEGPWLLNFLAEQGLLDSSSSTDESVSPDQSKKGKAETEDTPPVKKPEKTRVTAQAEIHPPNIGEGLGRNQVKRDINALAQFAKSKARWMVYQNELYVFDDSYWEKLGQDDAIRHIRDLCSEYRDIAEVLTNSEYKKIYDDLQHDPELNVKEEPTSPPGIVNFRDGEIDFLADSLYIQNHNPDHYFTSHIDVSAWDVLNPPMTGTTFERFASHISGGDETIRTQLLELLSIALTGVQLKHFYVLLGPSNSGKTQWGRFMQDLLGHGQVETVRGIHDFKDRWTAGSLAGKKLATCLDLPDKVLPAAAVGIMKQFCGGDPLKGEKKHTNSFTFYQKPLLLFAGNHPIRLSNAHKEEAFWKRMVVIPFSNPVREEDMELNLYQKLLNEAPYIIREAITAYQELAARNFILTRTEIPMEYRQSGVYGYDSVRNFVQDCLVEQEGAGVSTKELSEKFNDRSGQNLSLTVFSRALAAAVQDLFPQVVQVKRINKAGERGYKNLAFLPDV